MLSVLAYVSFPVSTVPQRLFCILDQVHSTDLRCEHYAISMVPWVQDFETGRGFQALYGGSWGFWYIVFSIGEINAITWCCSMLVCNEISLWHRSPHTDLWTHNTVPHTLTDKLNSEPTRLLAIDLAVDRSHEEFRLWPPWPPNCFIRRILTPEGFRTFHVSLSHCSPANTTECGANKPNRTSSTKVKWVRFEATLA